jgi:hypothetical protein
MVLAGCSKGNSSTAAQDPTTGPTSLVSIATPGRWPKFATYDAVDYKKPGLHPPLTPKQIANIQAVLEKVKPCQRQLIQYSFGNGFREPVVFFAVPPGEGSHIFGAGNVVYFPSDGSAIPMSDNPNAEQMEKRGLQWDIDHHPCEGLGTYP